MITLGYTFAILLGLLIISWLYMMLFTKPTFNNGVNRFMKNWNEGGAILLWYGIVLVVLLSIGIAKLILMFNFLEK